MYEKNNRVLIAIIIIWLDFIALATTYNSENFFSELFFTKKIFFVIAYIAMKICPIVYNAIKKNYNKCLNLCIMFLIWIFLFESCNISVEATVSRSPSFRAIGYFKYFGVSNIIEITGTAATVILIYALLFIKLMRKKYQKDSGFLSVFFLL